MHTSAASLGLRVNGAWERLPPGLRHRDVADVAVDSHDRPHLFVRHDSQVLVFSREGEFQYAFGNGLFRMAHGIAIDGEDCVYCVDNLDHTVRKFSPRGELLMTLGTPGIGSDTGIDPDAPVRVHSVERVRHPGPPFNGCTDVAIDGNGDILVSDGYGNGRIHRFSATGELLDSWGEVGSGPGQFRLPHAIAIAPDGRLLVADRENDRIQIFDGGGGYIGEWTGVQRPTDLAVAADGRVFVSELWRPAGNHGFVDDITTDRPGRISVLDASGEVRVRWGASTGDKNAPGNVIAPHGLCLDSHGDLYVAEVTYTFAVAPGLVPADHADHQIQKFVRTPSPRPAP
ncbi:peptidyl-alpha-hydroxyglycine alpha-amidating lyase family protein [Rhizomonospora bruguierae]|uniref:peptidyl-alpha-hydroxyglycine alpha-amidating lyase family protein n=1 Tax=Rhizomonospora bruguierae TaxID=1581705 RepID=UPI001BCAD1A1|nr:peptidyl-alpha-hydroxyglycine alpha-amidating lyase family protein [Micromonospora sp. NBRC 107566]